MEWWCQYTFSFLLLGISDLIAALKEVYAKMLHHGLKTEKKKKKNYTNKNQKVTCKTYFPFSVGSHSMVSVTHSPKTLNGKFQK